MAEARTEYRADIITIVWPFRLSLRKSVPPSLSRHVTSRI